MWIHSLNCNYAKKFRCHVPSKKGSCSMHEQRMLSPAYAYLQEMASSAMKIWAGLSLWLDSPSHRYPPSSVLRTFGKYREPLLNTVYLKKRSTTLYFSPFLSGNPKKGNWQTVHTQIRHCRVQHLIRVSNVCKQFGHFSLSKSYSLTYLKLKFDVYNEVKSM